MKTSLFSLFFTLTFSVAFSQNVSFGINVGLNYSALQVDQDLSLNNQIRTLTTEGKPGFHLGIQSLIKVVDRVKFSPQLLLGFSAIDMTVNYTNDSSSKITLEKVHIRVPLDLQLEILKGDNALYLISGIEYATNLANQKEGTFIALKDDYWSGRLGLGFRKNFVKFSVSPELTFIKSFSNIEKDNTLIVNEVITNLDQSIVSLSIKFQGLID